MRWVVGLDRDLGARARVAGRSLDLEQPLLDLRDFQLEQLDQEFRGDTRQHQLRSAAAAIDLQEEGPHAITDAQIFLGDHLVARQYRLDPAGLDDRVATFDALDRAGNQVLLARQEVIEDLLALGIADLLQDHLLRGLRADPTELDRLQRLLDVFVELDIRDQGTGLFQRHLAIGSFQDLVGHHMPAAEGAVVPAVAVDLHAYVNVLAEALLGRGRERLFQRGEHDVLLDVLLARQRIYQQQDLSAHNGSPL